MKKTLFVFSFTQLVAFYNLAAQNVGIGTASPLTKLTIQTPNNTDGFSHVSDGGIIFKETVGGVSAALGTYSNHTFRLVSNSVAVINIDPGGHVGVGTITPGNFKMKISDDIAGLSIENSYTLDNWELYTVGGNAGYLSFFFNDVLRATINNSTGAYTPISDERLKTNIKPMTAMLDKISKLYPCSYQIKNTNDKQEYNGFIAQDVLKLFPSLIVHNQIPGRKLDLYTMDYSGFGVIAIKGIQELQQIIDVQKESIKKLEARMAKLEEVIASITH